MTAQELIEKLRQMPPEAEVTYYDWEDQFGNVQRIREVLPPANTIERGSVVIK